MEYSGWRPALSHADRRLKVNAKAPTVKDVIPAIRFFDQLCWIGDEGVGCFVYETSEGLILIDCMRPDEGREHWVGMWGGTGITGFDVELREQYLLSLIKFAGLCEEFGCDVEDYIPPLCGQRQGAAGDLPEHCHRHRPPLCHRPPGVPALPAGVRYPLPRMTCP